MRIFKTLIFLVVIGAVFYVGFWLGQGSGLQDFSSEESFDLSLFWETWQRLEEKYIDKEKLDPQEMLYGAIGGMVKSVEDPYTVFLDPQETKTFLEDVSGEFEGVGMEIGIREGGLMVISPLEGTPAQKAGVKAGDKILKIDEKLTLDITIEEAVNLIRGPKGEAVTLTILRDDNGKTKDIIIVRDTIKVPSLKWELKEGEIAYLKLYHFTETATGDFKKAAREIIESEAASIILDLRNNPGGYLEVAQTIGGWFLKRGEVVVIEDFGKNEQKEYKASGPSKLLSYPLVVLINQGTASGSEILAAALRDNRNVKLVGTTSFGKGSVQEVERLRGEASLKVTIAKWLTPKGQLIDGKGLEPDIAIEITEEDYEQGRDPQLDKAIEVIKGMR